MPASRPSSQASAVNEPNGFQLKMKPRVRGTSLCDTARSKPDNAFTLLTRDNRNQLTMRMTQSFNSTACELERINNFHHDPEGCLCNSCTCGRHLCKLHVIKPDLTKNSIYRKDFDKKKAIPNIVAHAKGYERLKGPNLDLNSTYLKDFNKGEADQIERPHPEDLIKTGGPAPGLTSYSTHFPGYRGANQYVKPTDKHVRGEFPLRSRSTYNRSFDEKTPKKDDYEYFPDQLRTGKNWLGKTTYGSFFKAPNPEDYAKQAHIIEKLEKNPNYDHQYETTYKNDFLQTDTAICPAKIQLETRLRGFKTATKGKFSENADFKAMSPEFHAIATSKFSFV